MSNPGRLSSIGEQQFLTPVPAQERIVFVPLQLADHVKKKITDARPEGYSASLEGQLECLLVAVEHASALAVTRRAPASRIGEIRIAKSAWNNLSWEVALWFKTLPERAHFHSLTPGRNFSESYTRLSRQSRFLT